MVQKQIILVENEWLECYKIDFDKIQQETKLKR